MTWIWQKLSVWGGVHIQYQYLQDFGVLHPVISIVVESGRCFLRLKQIANLKANDFTMLQKKLYTR